MGKKKKGFFRLELAYLTDNIECEFELRYDNPEGYLLYWLLLDCQEAFLSRNHIHCEVSMTYLATNGQQCLINEQFRLAYTDIENEYGGVFFVTLRPQVFYLHRRLDFIEDRLGQIQSWLSEMKEQHNPGRESQAIEFILNTQKGFMDTIIDQFSNETVVDFGLVFCEPLTVQDDSKPRLVTTQSSKFPAEIRKLKEILKRSYQNQFYVKACVGTRETMREILQMCPKVLMMYCASAPAPTDGETEGQAYFMFESQVKLGDEDRIYPEDIYDFLDSYESNEKPRVMVLCSRGADELSKTLIEVGVTYVVVLRCYDMTEDVTAQKFLETFFLKMLSSQTVDKSFKDAKESTIREKASRVLSPTICCCFHAHKPNCRMNEMARSVGVMRVHELYHVPVCDCIRKLDGFHKINCKWVQGALFNLNAQFRIQQGQLVLYPPNYDVERMLGNQTELMLCCCALHPSEIPHEDLKFEMYKHPDNKEQSSLYTKEECDPECDIDIIDLTELAMVKQGHRIERIYGRNDFIVRLTDQFRDASSSVIILYGPVGSGRTSAISKSIAYMSERGLLQSEILYLNLSNCTKRVDFEFKFCQKAKLDRSCDEPSISTIYSDKRLVLVLDNCDGFIENSYDEFLEQMKELLARLNKPKIVLVVTDRTEKNFSNFLLGEKRLSFPPLEVLPAIDMLLSQCKWWIPLKQVNFKELQEIMSDEMLRYPKTILDILQFMKDSTGKTGKFNFNKLRTQTENLKLSLTNSENFLEQNLKQLSQTPEIYKLFLFVAQFQNGLSEHDFAIMSNSRGDKFSFVPADWRQLLSKLLAVGRPSTASDLEVGESYYCLIQKLSSSCRKVRVKKYILDYLLKNPPQQLPEMLFKAVAYLSNFSTVLLRLYRQRHYSHQRMLEHSNFSRCGFFQYEKNIRYAEYFDPQDYYPEKSQDMTRSIIGGRQLDKQIANIFSSNKALEDTEPYKSILMHQENFIALYHKDFTDYYTGLSPERKKVFKYYYQNILLNVPTLVHLIESHVSRSFLLYCIEESKKKVASLEPDYESFSNNILMIKLVLMRFDFDYDRNANYTIDSFRMCSYQLTNRSKLWPPNCEVVAMVKLEILNIEVFMKIKNFPSVVRTDDVADLVHSIQQFTTEIDRYRNPAKMRLDDEEQAQFRDLTGLDLLWAKFHCHIINFYFRQIMKSKFAGPFVEQYPPHRILEELLEACEIFRREDLSYLEVETLILIASLRLKFLERQPRSGSHKNVNDYLSIFRDVIKPCRQVMESSRINNKQKDGELANLSGIINERIWKATKSVIVLMRAAPILTAEGERILINGIRRSSNLKNMMEQAIIKKLAEQKVERQIFVRFEHLTLMNFKQIINSGCSILLMNFNITEGNNRELQIQFEGEWQPTQQIVTAKDLFQQITLSTVELLVLIGEKCSRLAESIEREFPQAALIITLDYSPVQHFMARKGYPNDKGFLSGYYEYSIKTLQKYSIIPFRIIAAEFFRLLSQKILSSPIPVRNKEMQFIYNSSREGSLIYAFGFTRQIANREDFDSIVQFRIHNLRRKNFELYFQPGQYHNVSTHKNELHNIKKSSSNFVGRQSLIVEVMHELQKTALRNSSCLINIHGVRSCGRSMFLDQLARVLLERGEYKNGIYIINAIEVETMHKGDIYEYLQKRKHEIFAPEYLQDKNIDGSHILLFIDDFHILNEKRNLLSRFLQTINDTGVNLIISSRDPLPNGSIPELATRQLQNYELKKMTMEEAAELSYTFIPLYDFNVYGAKFLEHFNKLRDKYSDSILPKILITEYRRLEKQAIREFYKEPDRYRSYAEYLDFFYEGVKPKKYKRSMRNNDSNEPPSGSLKNVKKHSNIQSTPKQFNDGRPLLPSLAKAESCFEMVEYENPK